MEKKLHWHVIGVEDKVSTIINTLKSDLDSQPEDKLRMIRKLKRWVDDLVRVKNGIDQIVESVQPDLEKRLRVKVRTPDTQYISLSPKLEQADR